MKCRLFLVEDGQYATHQEAVTQNNGWWVRFGQDLFVYVAERKASACFKALSTQRGLTLLKDLPDVKKGDACLVEQKGRIFQLEHPHRQVIHDQGRYLVASLPKNALKDLAEEQRTCFRLTPLQENTVVFDLHPASQSGKALRVEFAQDFKPLDTNELESDLVKLTSWQTRLSSSPEYQEAAQWANSTLQSLGYDSTIEPVTLDAGKTSLNVIASKPGTAVDGGSVYVVGAHLDSINHIDGESAPAPGADDNASGAAGVLALARWAASQRFKNTVTFVLFGGEEQGLFGSQQFVESMTEAQRQRTAGMINMDMIGSVNEERASVLLEGATLSQGMIDTLAAAARRYSSLLVETSLNPFASDHVPFIEAGIPAVLTIEGADSANGRVHTADDTLEFVNREFALDILNTVAASLHQWLEKTGQADNSQAGQADNHCDQCADESGTGHKTQLLLHYQQLLATYNRLYDAGNLPADLYPGYQAAWNEYQNLQNLTAVSLAGTGQHE